VAHGKLDGPLTGAWAVVRQPGDGGWWWRPKACGGGRSSAREEARRTMWGCESCLEGGGVNRQSNLKLT
jgi:hypothetical protein